MRDESLIDEMRAALSGDRERARQRRQPAQPPPPEPPAPSSQGAEPEPAEATPSKTLRERFGRRKRST